MTGPLDFDDDDEPMISAKEVFALAGAMLLIARGTIPRAEPPDWQPDRDGTVAEWAEDRVGPRAFAAAVAEMRAMTPAQRGQIADLAGFGDEFDA